jgi:hypothetical protein
VHDTLLEASFYYLSSKPKMSLFITFMSKGCDCATELKPPMGLYFISQIYKYGQPWWNDNGRGKPKNLERSLCQYHFVHHKSHMV